MADALIASRVEIPDGADAGIRELLDLAAGVQRSAARFLQNLEESRWGGMDPRGTQVLELLERSVEAATRRLLRMAHALRYEMLADRRAECAAAAQAAAEDSARVESIDPVGGDAPTAPDLVSPRVETPAVPVQRRPLHHHPADVPPQTEPDAAAPDTAAGSGGRRGAAASGTRGGAHLAVAARPGPG
ncbi:hypothetical protein [Kitasatospora sp. NPDC051914]|uniref:hypothetical protein n=1 Tax=Kitasatospora sp. NPDC051914 TaxID=3154945 RepID=UPI003426FF8D